MSELLDEQVKVAKKLMSELNITKSLIDGVMEKPAEFVRDFFSNAWGRPELALKMDEIRKRFGCLIYYVTHEESNFGEMYSFLIVSKYPEDWKYQFVKKYPDRMMSVDAYVWNVTDDNKSEMGRILVQNEEGLLLRVG